MFFIAEHSSSNDENIYGTLIGKHGKFLYAANSFENELRICRRNIFDTRGWHVIFVYPIDSWSTCACSETVAAAYGIVGDDLFLAAFGRVIIFLN